MNASGYYLGAVASSPASRSNYVYDQKATEKNFDICAVNNATSDENGACMKRLDPAAYNQ